MGSGVYIFEYHPGLDMTTGLEIVLLHAAFVVFEAGVLVYLSRKSWAEFLQSVELLSIGEHLQKEGQIDLSYQLDKPQSAADIPLTPFLLRSMNSSMKPVNCLMKFRGSVMISISHAKLSSQGPASKATKQI